MGAKSIRSPVSPCPSSPPIDGGAPQGAPLTIRYMAKILLSWEAGAYLGHEMLVTCAGVLLREAGHDVVIYAPHGSKTNHAAAAAGIRWEQLDEAPTAQAPPSELAWESRATTLWKFGFHSSEVIGERFRAWDVVLHREQPDVVVLQAAPFAQVAAHALGYASVEFGIGFDVPPRLSPFPAFRGGEHFDASAALQLEATILQRVSRAVARSLSADSLHTLVSGQRRLVTSILELDHYDGIGDTSRQFVGPLPGVALDAVRPKWSRGKPRTLAYVRAEFIDTTSFIKAIADLRGDAVVVCIGADAAAVALARSRGVRLHAAPISMADLLPSADLVVSHGGGLMGEALIRGRPCVALPSHYEQFMTASTLRRRKLGVMLNPKQPAQYFAGLRHALMDSEIRHHVASMARAHASTASDAGVSFVKAVESLLVGGG